MSLNNNEEKILKLLRDNPYLSQKELASELGLSRPAVANLISGLTQNGYILGKPYVLKTKEYITCIGGANVDYGFKLHNDLVMKTSNPVSESSSYGGVVRNVAENLSRLNEDVALMTLIGQDSTGEQLINDMKHFMNVDAIERLEGKSTGSYYAVLNTSGSMAVGFANMAIYNNMDRDWIIRHKKQLHQSKWLIADMNMTKEALEALIEFSNTHDKPLAIVGVSSPKMSHLPNDLKGVKVLITNRDEALTYFNKDDDATQDLVQLWLDKGITNVVITQGEKGAYYGNAKGIHHQPARSINNHEIKDVTGAGDAFSAATIYGLINNMSLEKSTQYGTVSAALTIQTLDAVNKNLSKKRIEKEFDTNDTQ
ncbi:MAG: carbohydrate kinase [Candidatus Izemoplasma sp.]|nr:carbohydrate kinase [Candidatus Izemoplasma sp.]